MSDRDPHVHVIIFHFVLINHIHIANNRLPTSGVDERWSGWVRNTGCGITHRALVYASAKKFNLGFYYNTEKPCQNATETMEMVRDFHPHLRTRHTFNIVFLVCWDFLSHSGNFMQTFGFILKYPPTVWILWVKRDKINLKIVIFYFLHRGFIDIANQFYSVSSMKRGLGKYSQNSI